MINKKKNNDTLIKGLTKAIVAVETCGPQAGIIPLVHWHLGSAKYVFKINRCAPLFIQPYSVVKTIINLPLEGILYTIHLQWFRRWFIIGFTTLTDRVTKCYQPARWVYKANYTPTVKMSNCRLKPWNGQRQPLHSTATGMDYDPANQVGWFRYLNLFACIARGNQIYGASLVIGSPSFAQQTAQTYIYIILHYIG